MRRVGSKGTLDRARPLSGVLKRQRSIPNSRETKLFLLSGRRTLPLETHIQPVRKQESSPEEDPEPVPTDERTEPDTDEDSVNSEDYSFIREAKARAIEDSYTHSSDDLDLKPALHLSRRVIFTAQRSSLRKGVTVRARVGRGCLWVGVALERLGVKGTKGRRYDVGITSELRNKWVGKGIYNHIPGVLGLYRVADLCEMLKTSLWPNIFPISFNSCKEAYSFSRYRSQHPKYLWLRRGLHPPFKVKTVSAHSAIKG